MVQTETFNTRAHYTHTHTTHVSIPVMLNWQEEIKPEVHRCSFMAQEQKSTRMW